jgi:hypothetical protein
MADIQYQTLNPFSGIMQGIQTGLTMRSKKAPENEMEMSDPGEPQKVKAIDLLGAEYQDVLKYEELDKKIKKIKNVTPEQRMKIMQTACKSGAIKTPIVQSVALNDDIINPEETINVMKSIKNNDPNAAIDMEILITKLGGEQSPGGAAVATKLREVETKQKEFNQQRVQILEKTLDRIDEYNINPKKWVDEYGQMNPQTKKVVGNWQNYMKELATLDPERAKARLEELKSKRNGGASPKNFAGLKRTKEGFTRQPFSDISIEAGLARHPDIIPSTAYSLEPESLGGRYMAEGELEEKERQKLVSKLPKPTKRNQKANDNVIGAYVEAYGAKEAASALKRDGWRP